MAEIKMDVSEYEAMKENKRLLEVSLEKEETLRVEIQDVKNEKIEALKEAKKEVVTALENAKMKVIKTTQSTVHEFVKTRLPTYEIAENIRRFYESMRRGEYESMHRTNSSFDRHRHPGGFNNSGMTERFIRSLDGIFYTDRVKTTDPEITSVETVGLDDVKAELRIEIKNDIDQETVKKLEDYDRLLKSNKTLREKNDSLSSVFSENATLREDNDKLEKDLKQSVKDERTLVQALNKYKPTWFGLYKNSKN